MITIILCILLLLIIKNRNNHLELVDTRQIWYCHTCTLKPLINGSISIDINGYHSLDYREDIFRISHVAINLVKYPNTFFRSLHFDIQ